MRKLMSILCALLFVLAAFALSPMFFGLRPAEAASSRACPGGWTISSAVTLDGDTCTVASNIVIQSGGNLTMKNSKIRMNLASSVQYHIEIQSGGKLHVLQGSNITTTNTAYYSHMDALAGSTLEIRDSNVSQMGYMMPDFGIEIYTSNAVIDHSNITGGFEGVYVQDASATIRNSTIAFMGYHGIETTNSNSLIADNKIKECDNRGIMLDSGGATQRVVNNVLTKNYEGIHVKVGTSSIIEGNTINQSKNAGRGIIVDQSNPIIVDNHITEVNVGIHYISLSAGRAENNLIEFGDGNQDVGIKVLQQSNPTIKGNTIYKFYRGMTVYGFSDPVVDGNTISHTTDGIYFQNGKGTFRNNTINDSLNAAANMISGTDAKFYDNWFHDSLGDGIHVDASTIVAINNNISKNPNDGIHLMSTSYADIRDNEFYWNGYGVGLDDTAKASMKNNDFYDNPGMGIQVRGTGNHFDWTIDKQLLVRNNDLDLAGNLTVTASGGLEIRSSTLKVRSTATQNWWIDSSGPLFLNQSFIQAQDQSKPYSLRAKAGLTVVDGGIRDAGYTLAGNGEDAGVFITGAPGSFLRSTVTQGYYGIIAHATTVTVEKCNIDNQDMSGIRATGGASVIVGNSSLQTNTDKDLWLNGASTIDMRNSTFTANKVTFGDATSTLHVSWFVRVKVVWPDASGLPGDPVSGATVKIIDKGGATVSTTTTDATGWAPGVFILKQYSKTQSTQTDYSPYNITGSINPVVAGTKIETIDASKDVIIILGDLTPPTLVITSPTEGQVFNVMDIDIRGTAADSESGIKKVEVSIDNGASWRLATGTTTWNITRMLPDGISDVMAKATNMAGGVTTVTVKNILVDKTPPIITWDSPANNTALNKKNVTVAGSTEAYANVTINTVQQSVGLDGKFSVDLPLVEGPNTITITATDRAGNTRSSTRYVTVDTIAPILEIDGPATRTVSVVQMDVTGRTEPGARVTVNSGAVSVNQTGGFSYFVTLSQGPNTYRFEATDKVGNKNSTTIVIVLDTKAPSLTIVFPSDGMNVKNKTINAQALTDPNTDGSIKGYINGNEVVVAAGGEFSTSITLAEGWNTISFKVEDAAGNNVTKTTRAMLDSTLPTISEISPADGAQVLNTQTTVWISGKTEGGSTVVVNGKTVKAGNNGDFTVEVPLAVGPNTITIEVTDKAGNKITKTMTITRKSTGGNGNCTTNCGDGNETPGTDWGKYLPFILIIIVVVIVIAGAAIAMGGKKGPTPPPGGRRRPDERGRPGDRYGDSRRDPYARDRGGSDQRYPSKPGERDRYQDDQYDQGYDSGSEGQYQDNYQDGYGEGQDQGYDQGADQQGYDDQGYGDDQYDQGYDQGRRY